MKISDRAKSNILERIRKRAPDLKNIEMHFVKSNNREYKAVFETTVGKKKIISVKKCESLGRAINKCLPAFIKQIELQKKKRISSSHSDLREFFNLPSNYDSEENSFEDTFLTQ